MGIACEELPLHIKNVSTIDLFRVNELEVRDESLKQRWMTVRQWLDGSHPTFEGKKHSREARITAAELQHLLRVGQVEPTSFDEVRATCSVFPVPEWTKGRRRLIKHTEDLNDVFGRETLLHLQLIKAQELPATVHDGKYAITLDFAAWFDQFPLSSSERCYHCFPFQGQWYRLTRLPMGQRQAVDVASTVTDMLVSFGVPAGVRIDTYIDNVRFLSDDPRALVATAFKFVERARGIGATINELTDSENAHEALRKLVHSEGEFLGVGFDYANKKVRVGSKAISKLVKLRELLEGDRFTVQNFLALYGVLFFAAQVTRPKLCDRYYCLKEYSDIARRVQADPAILATQYKGPPKRLQLLREWIAETEKNTYVTAFRKTEIQNAERVLVTDASGWGWGALLWDATTGRVSDVACKWEKEWRAKGTSTWSETEAISRALRHFFPTGEPGELIVLSDNTAAVGAFQKGRSGIYALNKAIALAQGAVAGSRPAFYHIEGATNPADPLSRATGMGGEGGYKKATDHVISIMMGIRDKNLPVPVDNNSNDKEGNLWGGRNEVTFVPQPHNGETLR